MLRLCAKAGLAKLGVVAIGGTKMAADASLKTNRTRETIAARAAKIVVQYEHDIQRQQRQTVAHPSGGKGQPKLPMRHRPLEHPGCSLTSRH